MANQIQFGVGVNATGFEAGMRDIEQIAGLSGARMNSALSGGFMSHGGPGGGISGSIRESLVIVREWGRGNFTRMPGSIILLSQYLGGLNLLIKNSASESIKSALAERRLAQELGIVAVQAEEKAVASGAAVVAGMADTDTAMIEAVADAKLADAAKAAALAQDAKAASAERAAKIQLFSAKTGLTAFGWIGLALIAVGAAAYFTIRYFHNLAIAEKNTADLTDNTTRSFVDQAKQLKSAAEAHQEYIDWLKKVAESERGAKDAIEEGLKALREKAHLERELASAKGASHVALAAMDLAQLKAESEYLEKSTTALKAKIEADKAEGSAAETRKQQFMGDEEGPNTAGALKAANDKAEEAAAVLRAVEEAMKTKTFGTGKFLPNPGGFGYGPEYMRPATDEDVLRVKVGTKEYSLSLREAIDKHREEASEVERLASIEKEINDTLSTKKALTEKDVERLNRLESEKGEIETKMGLAGTAAQTAAIEDAKKGMGKSGASDSLVKVGNFLGSSRGQIETLQQETNRLHREGNRSLARIESNTRRRAGEGSHWSGPGGGN